MEVEGTLTLEPAVVRVTLQQPTAHRLLTGDHICRLSLIKPVGLLSCPPARAHMCCSSRSTPRHHSASGG